VAEPNLEGMLTDFPLADVLTFLNMGQKTGVLNVARADHAARIYMEDGEVVHVTSTNPRLRLTRFLAARGLLTEDTAAAVERRALKESRPPRELVAETGQAEPAEVEDLEKILSGEIVFDAMRWRDGRFRFEAGHRPEPGATLLSIRVQNLILEGVRRLDEASRLEEEQIDLNLVVTLVAASGPLESEVVLTPREWGVISLINGKRTLDEIFALAPSDSESETWLVLQRLQAARLIRMHPKLPEESGLAGTTLLSDTYWRTAEMALLGGEIAAPPPVPESQPDPFGTRPNIQVPEDTHLLTGEEVSTSRNVFGDRLPARLVGTDNTLVFDLIRPIQTVGRADSNDIVLAHNSVSKQHATIMQEMGRWRLMDLKSTNGTIVNDLKVAEYYLMPGDEVRFGAFTFLFDAVSTAASAAQP